MPCVKDLIGNWIADAIEGSTIVHRIFETIWIFRPFPPLLSNVIVRFEENVQMINPKQHYFVWRRDMKTIFFLLNTRIPFTLHVSSNASYNKVVPEAHKYVNVT